MLIAFFVNDMEREFAGYTTTVLAYEAAQPRPRRLLRHARPISCSPPTTSLHVHGRFLPKKKFKDRDGFLHDAAGRRCKIEPARHDGGRRADAAQRPLARCAGRCRGRRRSGSCSGARRQSAGSSCVNDPDSLSKAINKLYFQSFPVEARAETLISRNEDDIKAFAKAHKDNIILKPLQGSGGSGVFKLDAKAKSNINQMIEAIGRDGYIIAQAYVPAAKKGDIRLFLMNGVPLQIDGKYAALAPGRVEGRHPLQHPCRRHGRSGRDRQDRASRRRDDPAQADRRRHVPGRDRHRRRQDPRGERLLARQSRQLLTPRRGRFRLPIVDALERKVEIAKDYAQTFDNRHLAVL